MQVNDQVKNPAAFLQVLRSLAPIAAGLEAVERITLF
jgi:hypothetical protein